LRVAVAGGTGRVGRHVVEVLEGSGHHAVVLARSSGVDLMSGDALPDALIGVDAVIDVTNRPAADRETARGFFETTTGNLLTAEQDAGVGHHVLLSILGLDRVEGNAHYAGKRRQEELVQAARVPATIVRATPFHDFAAMVVGWTRHGDTARIPPLLIQPVAVADVAEVLVEVATGAPGAGRIDLADPEPQDLVDMARRTLTARGEDVRIVPTWRGIFGTEMAGEVLLPGPDARIIPTTFDTWLAQVRASAK
jgi:uncharacterized protein YbjT (DUF2867 family)